MDYLFKCISEDDAPELKEEYYQDLNFVTKGLTKAIEHPNMKPSTNFLKKVLQFITDIQESMELLSQFVETSEQELEQLRPLKEYVWFENDFTEDELEDDPEYEDEDLYD